MIEQPFRLLRTFTELRVLLFTKEDAIRNDEDIVESLGTTHISSLQQVHGNRTIHVGGPTARIVQADGMLTQNTNLVLTIRTADCQSFVMYEPEKRVLGVLHVGWRGLIAGAIPEFFATLRAEWNIAPEDVYVAAGPSLCQQCADFSNPRTELPQIDLRFIAEDCVDLRGSADAQLAALGIASDRFERHSDCTRCQPEKYWTYRGGDKEEVEAGMSNVLACMMR
ncbi:MAG: polyphenol oxidase family protein [Candidatus Peribacteraceae bacterium]|jgi:hypothetical protein